MNDYRPRFSFEISEEQQDRANKLISTYGLRKAVFSHILDEVLDLIDQHGEIVIGAILSTRPRVTITSLQTAEKAGKAMNPDGNARGSST
jgi:hypothetical protein